MTTVALSSGEHARLVYDTPLPLSRPRALRTLLAEIGLLLLTALFATPAVLAAAGHEQAWLAVATKSHFARQVTGFAGLFVILAQLSMVARVRLRGASARRRWLQLHKVTGALLLLAVVVHTGGRSGSNLNAVLWGALCAMLALAQGGHVFKAWVRLRALSLSSPATVSLDAVTNTDQGWVHLAGYQLHVVLALVVAVLLGAHAVSVYLY